MQLDYKFLDTVNLASWAKLHPDIVREIKQTTNFLHEKATLRQRIWHVQHNQLTPKSCRGCSTIVNWCNSRNIYKTYCSVACQRADHEYVTKRQATMLANHGTANVFNDVEKMKSARLLRIGVEFPAQRADILDKIKQTTKDRHGSATVLTLPETQARRLDAIEKLGGQVAVNALISQARTKQQTYQYWLQHNAHGRMVSPHMTYTKLNHANWLTIKHKTDSLTSIAHQLNVGQPIVTKAFQKYKLVVSGGKSAPQQQLTDWLISQGQTIESNTRRLISPQEIDIYIPDKKLAIEFNGIWWHSENGGGKTSKYHTNKTDKCASLGIRLIHIFENEWINQQDIVKSRILASIGNTQNVIYARKCMINEISQYTANHFFDQTHLQGRLHQPSINYGLFVDGELISVMSFGKIRYGSTTGYEIYRFSSKLNTSVVGGASRLFTHFIKTHKPDVVISYADRRWTVLDGSVYQNIGFKFDKVTPPNYWYFHKSDRLKLLHRQNFQKHKLRTRLAQYDSELSESENMFANGYDRIWDCGHVRWVWTK